MIDSVEMNVSYFNGGNYKAEKPTDAEELDVTWFVTKMYPLVLYLEALSAISKCCGRRKRVKNKDD